MLSWEACWRPYRSSLDAFGRYLRKNGIEAITAITLSLLEGYNHYRTKVEKRDVKTAYNDALVIKGVVQVVGKAESRNHRGKPCSGLGNTGAGETKAAHIYR